MDIAALGYKIDSSGAVSATKDLNAMSEAAKKAETSASSLSGGAAKAESAVDALGKDARTTAGSLDAAAAAGAKASSATSALELKAREAGFTLAGYEQHLARAAKDQAVLAAEARQTALAVERSNAAIASTPARAGGGAAMPVINGGSIQAAEAGVAKAANSTRALTRNLVSASAASAIFSGDMGKIGTAALVTASSIDATAAAALLFTPIGLAMAAAVAVAAGAFVLFKSDCDKAADNDAFVKSLGLSDKELKKLGNTSVTTGDILKGFWRTIDQDGKVSKTFKDVKEAGVGAFRAVLEGVEWFVAGAYAGLNAVAHAMKGVAMVATGDFSGFDYFNHSLDNIIKDAKDAKAAFEAFGEAVKQNTVDVNHERKSADAEAIKSARTAKVIRDETKADPNRWKVKNNNDGGFSVLGNFKIRDVQDSVSGLIKLIHPLRDEFAGLGQDIAQSLGQGIVYGDNLGKSVAGAFQRIAASWAANAIQTIFDKLIGSAGSNGTGSIGSVFDKADAWFSNIGHNAAGTDNWRGGPTWVGEKGPEIVNLPRGASVTPNNQIGGGTISQSDLHAVAALVASAIHAKLNETANSMKSYSDRQIYSFDRGLPRRLGQINRLGT